MDPARGASGTPSFTPYAPDASAPKSPSSGASGGGPSSGAAGDGPSSGAGGDTGAQGGAGLAASGGEGGNVGSASSSGEGGVAGSQAPPPAPCDGVPEKPLPYAIAADFPYVFPLNAVQTWTILPALDCNQASFPDVPDGADAGVDVADADGGVGPVAIPGGGQTPVTSCYAFEYMPDGCVSANGGGVDGGIDPSTDAGIALVADCWAGVILTSEPLLQDSLGICIAPGATVIHFKARASRDGARVKFGAIRAGLGETEFFLEISRQWQDYSVSIPAGEDYDNEPTSLFGGVWNGFSVVVEPEDHAGGTYILVSDVVWAAS